MAIFHGNAIPSGAAQQEVWSPSSNDWDYSYAGGDWPVAGNTLGDHTIGAYIDNVGGDNALDCLITLDGDFDIEWTATGINHSNFGVHEIASDGSRTTTTRLGLDQASDKSWYKQVDGTPINNFFYGSSAKGAYTFAVGSVIKISRVSGVITFYDDGVSAHAFSDTSTNPVRFYVGGNGIAYDTNFDNLLITDTVGIQRDGTLNYTASGTGRLGGGLSNLHQGTRFTPTRSGTVTAVKSIITTVATSLNSIVGIYEDDGTNPASQVGSNSDNYNITTGATITHSFSATDVILKKGSSYWIVWSDSDNGSGDVTFSRIAGRGTDQGTGSHATTIASISDSDSSDLAFEIVIDASSGEPTPDHDTLLLIHSDDSDGSTTFVDSSQFARVDTVSGQVQHDTAQKVFGASSILFDGSGDYLSFPDAPEWKCEGDFTIELWVRFASMSPKMALINQQSASGNANTNFYLQSEPTGKLELSFGHNGGAVMTNAQTTTVLSADTWYHIALIKVGDIGGNNGTLMIAVNGTIETTATGNMDGTNLSSTMDIGFSNDTSVGDFSGWMDEIRISNVARWDADFTPPTSAYP
jgi:hypothetical protein